MLQLTNLLSAQRKEILNKDEAIRKLQHKEHDLSNELLKNMEEQVFLTNRLPFIEKQFKQAQ